ncbi:FAD-dependent oxidoreductase [Rhodococcus qingshengii]|uniref:FAD-dependent oxidoreductase n=1 Tax=Rhodococcus qingshengii TaxID=334542 RepID=UPI0027E3ABE0|nr:FAD-dependent oxidoreductase [Rhodococcus qingshengii]
MRLTHSQHVIDSVQISDLDSAGRPYDSRSLPFHHVLVTLDDDSTIETDYVLVAVGRAPNTAGIGLEEAGIDLQKGWIKTDERLSTSIENVYAVGDVVEGLQLAHRGFAHGIFVAEEIAGLSPLPVQDASIPRATYSDPELASVGLPETLAREQFVESVTTYEYNLAGNGKSQILNTAGVVELVKDPSGSIVGVHMAGSRSSEQAGEASLIVALGATPESISA